MWYMKIFTGEQAAFLNSVTREIPAILDNFNIVARLDPSVRWQWSEEMLREVYRDGWFVNSPVKGEDAETIREHKSFHLPELIDMYYPAEMRSTLKAYADVHDNQEAIAHALIKGVRRDLNPRFNKNSYKLSEQEKEGVEQIAISMLLEGEPEKMAIWREYKTKETETSIEFSGLDKLCVMWKCVNFVESGRYSFSDFQRFWDYWPLDKVRETLPSTIANAYEDDLWPRIQELRNG
jgi:5'-deoxynucleotidase YfbR-like HD superfamily hydrolase